MVNWIVLAAAYRDVGGYPWDMYQAVDLMRYGCGEDGHALVPIDRVWEVVVLVSIVDPLETHAL